LKNHYLNFSFSRKDHPFLLLWAYFDWKVIELKVNYLK